MTDSRVLTNNGLASVLAELPGRISSRWLGVVPAVFAAALAVSPAHAAAETAAPAGAPVLRLAQAAPEEEPAGEAEVVPVPAEEQPAEAAETPGEEPAAETLAEDGAAEAAGESPAVEGLPGFPPILRSEADMPETVRRTWMGLRDVARRGDIEALRPLIDAQPVPPAFAFDEIDEPILYLKSLSGDPEGREILAILLEVLESGFVLADPDTPEAMYLWPYFARYPLEALTPEQMVEMFTLLTAGDYQDMLSYGAYIFFRVGISPDGTWQFFVAGD